MFESARIKLTAWYLAIIIVVSFIFSATIYFNAENEFARFGGARLWSLEELNENHDELVSPPLRARRLDPQIIQEAETRFLIRLGIANVAIIVFSGFASYFLAGLTLAPIKKSLDDQKRFIADASHELRTPLTSLRTEIEVALRNKKLTAPSAKKILESNLEEVIGLQSLSDNLLELAQNGTLINPKNMEAVSAKEIISSAVKKVEPLARKKNIKIKNGVASGKIWGVKDRISEVFVILLDNAIKYSYEGGNVEITAKKIKNKTEFSITDFGIGIEKKDLSHIFDRFYRADSARAESGYGLGLSIAKKIVDAHGGSVFAESIPGKKTTFNVLLS